MSTEQKPAAELENKWRKVLIEAQQAEVKGDLVSAEKFFKEALAMAETSFGSDHHNVVLSLNRLGELYRLRNDFAQAESCYRRAYELAASRQFEDKALVAGQSTILAKMLVAQHKVEEALDFECAEEVYLDAAGLALLSGDKKTALHYLQSGVKVLHELGSLAPRAHAALQWLSYGRMLRTAGDYELAEQVLRAALDCHEIAGQIDPFLITSIVDALAHVLNEQSRAHEANELWEKYRQYNIN
jgi:tetratricopeptide (TPR) repeat protein